MTARGEHHRTNFVRHINKRHPALHAQQVLIAGTVRANVQAQVVGLLSGAQVFGNITTREFSSEEDSSFQGELLLLE